MTIWKEMWRVVPSTVDDNRPYGPWIIVNNHGQAIASAGDGCSSPKGAMLIAAAPQMARVLWALGERTRAKQGCACCGATVNDPSNELESGHQPGCALGKVLQKAGCDDWPADFDPSPYVKMVDRFL